MPSISTVEYKRLLHDAYSAALFSPTELRECRTFPEFEYLVRDRQRVMPTSYHFTKKTIQRAWNLHSHIQGYILNQNHSRDNNHFVIAVDTIKSLFNCDNNSIKVVLRDVHKVFAHMKLDSYNTTTKMYLSSDLTCVKFRGIQNLNYYSDQCFVGGISLETIVRGPSTTDYTFPQRVEVPNIFLNPIQNMNPNIVFALTSNF